MVFLLDSSVNNVCSLLYSEHYRDKKGFLGINIDPPGGVNEREFEIWRYPPSPTATKYKAFFAGRDAHLKDVFLNIAIKTKRTFTHHMARSE